MTNDAVIYSTVTQEVAEHVRRAAGARQWTLGQYLEALVELHETVRRRADIGGSFGNDALKAVLSANGLQTVEA